MSNRKNIRFQSVLAITLVLVFVLIAILAEVFAPTTGELVDGVQLAENHAIKYRIRPARMPSWNNPGTNGYFLCTHTWFTRCACLWSDNRLAYSVDRPFRGDGWQHEWRLGEPAQHAFH